MANLWNVSQPSALDQWEIKEQLFLASIIRKQEHRRICWKEVSKQMDVVCDREFGWRPWYWYSPQNCEAQYNHMLDTVVGPCKHSIAVSGKEEGTENAIYDHFAEKRKAELNDLIHRNQVWYKKNFFDVKLALKRGELTQDQLRELYNELKHKDESIRLEKMRKENQRRERKRMQELHGFWGSLEESGDLQASDGNPSSVDAKWEPIICNSRPVLTSLSAASPTQQASVQASTSTLSSLLKSPTSVAADISKTATYPQILLSPSKSAQTPSMLLVKNKSPTQLSEPLSASPGKQASHSHQSPMNECNREEVPMDIEEDTLGDTKITSTESDDHDANEEQQLLEIFKNIGNIDELVIDVEDVINVEVAILEDGDEEHITEAINSADLETKLRSHTAHNADIANETEMPIENEFFKSAEKKPAEYKSNKKDVFEFSDDSTDNIPLATVAFGCKEISPECEAAPEKTFTKHADALVSKAKVRDERHERENMKEKKEPNIADGKPITVPDSNSTQVKTTIAKEVSAITSAKSSLDSKIPVEEVALEYEEAVLMTSSGAEAMPPEVDESILKAIKSVNPIPVADADDDLCTTDASNYKKHDDKKAKRAASPEHRRKYETGSAAREHDALRRLPDHGSSESPIIENVSAALYKTRNSSTQAIDLNAVLPISCERDSKQTLLALFQALQPQKYAAFFARMRAERGCMDICNRPMDFQLMKKDIESDVITCISELKNAALVMAYNAAAVCQPHAEEYSTILEFMQEIRGLREFKEHQDKTKKSKKETKETSSLKPSGKKGGRKRKQH